MKSTHFFLQKEKKDEKNYEYEKDFVEKNLIAYIGNKRRLLPLILRGLKEIEANGSIKIDRQGMFVDYFSGTGVVSRLAKSLGFCVIANDWEYYSKVINQAFLLNDDSFLETFDSEGGLKKILDELNDLTQKQGEGYISTYYCPQSTDNFSQKNEQERMFYTRQNGILIDNIRQEIEMRYGGKNDIQNKKKKQFLLALLLLQCSKRSNTSGIFKAFHCGFGGRKKDALSRILHPVTLEMPALSKKNSKNNKVYSVDALKIKDKIGHQKVEIAYLDPPYNQHQYGSNYHLLNTIALNDQPKIEKKFWINGKKINKGGIRKDWKKTKSNFCYRDSALKEFQTLIKDINAKYIVVSYSVEGIIDFEDILNALAKKGRVAIVTQGYTRFRGGRQCNTTTKKNLEFILIVDTNLTCRKKDLENVRGVIARDRIQIAWQEPLAAAKEKDGYCIKKDVKKKKYFLWCIRENVSLSLDKHLCLTPESLTTIFSLPFAQQLQLIANMEKIANKPSDEKIRALLKIIEKDTFAEKNFLIKELDRLLQKINPKKTPEIYKNTLRDFSALQEKFS